MHITNRRLPLECERGKGRQCSSLRALSRSFLSLAIGNLSRRLLLISFLFLISFVNLLPVVQSQPSAEPPEQPLFRRELLLKPERILQEMDRVRQGVLRQMPLEEFEAKVQRAARAEAPKNAPRLLEVSYRAVLKENALHGTGQWKVLNPDASPAVLRLAPLNLALRRLRFENRDALLADFDGKVPGLLLDETGPQAVSIEWTLRGESSPEGLHFDLRVPSCAIASLELDLPAAHAVSVRPEGCLVSGPHPADQQEQCRWRVGFAGQSQLHLEIRPTQGLNLPPPLVFTTLKTTQKLNPDSVEAEYQFDFKVLQRGVQELRLECDPALRPYDVIIPQLESWELTRRDLSPKAVGPPAPAVVLVRLRESVQAGTLRLVCLAPLDSAGGDPSRPRSSRLVAWSSPAARLNHSVLRGETLTLQLHPDLRMEDWKAGAFRLTKNVTEANGTQVWTLVGGSLEADKPPQGPEQRRPSARLQAQEVEFLARQLTRWKVGPEKADVTIEVAYQVTHGRLFELPLTLPADWEVDRILLSPSKLLRTWTVRKTGDRSTLIIDLEHPLVPSSRGGDGAAKPAMGSGNSTAPLLTVWLRPSRDLRELVGAKPGAEMKFPFPDVVPIGARLFEGALAIDFDQQLYDGVPETTAPLGPPDGEGPWGAQTPDYYYPYRGKGVQGVLRLQQRTPRLRARSSSEVVLASGRAALSAHLYLFPEVGSADTLDVTFSAPLTGKWQWRPGRSNIEVRNFERLPVVEAASQLRALGAHDALGAACSLAVPPGERWRITLTRPLREPAILNGVCELGRVDPKAPWEIPLLTVPSANRMDGEVKLFLSGADVVQIDAEGLVETRSPSAAGARTGAPSPWRSFSYGSPPFSLSLRGKALASDPTTEAHADHAFLTTYVEPDGKQLHHFRFQLWNWRQQTVPVRLPSSANLLVVRVDGHWVTQMPPMQTSEEGVTIELPVPAGEGGPPASDRAVRFFEVLYSVEAPRWMLWTKLHAAPPSLPVKTLAYRNTWCLPPGLTPLLDGKQRSLPGPSTGGSWERGGLGAWERLPRSGILELWRGRSLTFSGHDREIQQEERMERAAVALSRAKLANLGELIDRLVYEHLKDKGPLVLDTEALAEAGLTLATPLPDANLDATKTTRPWESLELVYVPCQWAPLLTTQRQRESWLAARHSASPSESIELAVAEAAVQGRDTSARFWNAADWLRRSQGTEPGGGQRSFFTAYQSEFPWTEWEPIAQAQDESTFLIVRQEMVPGIGVGVAALLCLIFWRTNLSNPRRRLALLLFWLAVGGLTMLWLPTSLQGLAWWPLVAGSVIAFVWYLWSAGRNLPTSETAPPPPTVERGGAVAGILALICAAGLGSQAAGPETWTVFVLPGPENIPEKLTVLVPSDLLKQLDAVGQRTEASPQDVVVLSAMYESQINKDACEVRAVFQIYCSADEPRFFTLPLDGVQLQEDLLLDGARAYATAAPAPQMGYVLRVKDRGVHTIRARFQVSVQAQGEDRSMRFVAPALLQNQLRLEAPVGARYVQAQVGQGPARGAQQISTDPAGKVHLEADLGRPSALLQPSVPIQVRWRQEGPAARPPVVQVTEAYLWHLRADASTLTALLRWNITQAPLTRLNVHLPDELEVQSTELGNLSTGGPVRLKSALVVGEKGKRRLQIDFSGPVMGEVPITLQLVPARPFPSSAELPLPAPQAEPSVDPVLAAYRLEGLEGRVTEIRGMVSHPPEKFADAWKKLGQGDRLVPTRAFSFPRRSGAAPLLRLQMNMPPTRGSATQEVAWKVNLQQAEFRATVRLHVPNEDLAYLEWDAPGVDTITSVSGPDVRHWTRTGTRVQIWFQRSWARTEVQLAGWLPLRPSPKGGPVVFALPVFRLSSSLEPRTIVRLISGSDATLLLTDHANLQPLPDLRSTDQDLAFVATQPSYRASFQVRPATAAADVKILTLVEVRDQQLVFVARVDYLIRQGELRRAVVRLRNWPWEVQLDPRDPQMGTSLQKGPGDDRVWTVHLPPGINSRYSLTLTGTIPLDKVSGGIAMPDVSVPRAERQERWLAVGSRDLLVETSQGLLPVSDLDRELQQLQQLKLWSAEADRVRKAGQLFRIEAGNWGPRLLLRSRPGGTNPVQLFLTEQTSSVVDGQHWSHQAVYWLYHDASTDLTVQLPEGANLVGVTIDAMPVTPLQPSPQHLWLPLPGGAGLHTIRLRWRFGSDIEKLDQPILARPRIEGAAEGPQLWTVHVPAEYQASGRPPRPSSSEQEAELISRAGMEVCRAEAFFSLSRLLVEQGRDREGAVRQQLAALQKRFYESSRYANQGLNAAKTLLREEEPNYSRLTSRLEQLDESNLDFLDKLKELQNQNRQLAQAHGFEDLRARAERQAQSGGPPEPLTSLYPLAQVPDATGLEGSRLPGTRSGVLPAFGTPMHWQGDPDSALPRVHLTPLRTGQTKRAFAASLLLLVLLLVAWIVSYFPGVLSWVRAFWPEQMALLGCIGWQTLGFNLVVAFLILLGLSARLIVLLQGSLSLLRRWKPATPASQGDGGPAM